MLSDRNARLWRIIQWELKAYAAIVAIGAAIVLLGILL